MGRVYKYLSYGDRKRIESMWAIGHRPKEIAYDLGVHTATIYNELKRGNTGADDHNQRPAYSADVAERRLQDGFKRRGRRPAS